MNVCANGVGRRRFALAVMLVGAMLLVAACSNPSRPAPTSTPWPTPLVSAKPTYVVQRGTVVDQFFLTGQVVPVVWDGLFFTVDGKLASIKVADGMEVHKGEILAELEMKVLSDQLAQAQITLEQAQDQLAQQEAARQRALNQARDALLLEHIALEKLQRVAEENLPIQQSLAEKELARARLNLQKAQAEYDKVSWRSDIASLPQALALQQATLEYEIAEARYKLQSLSDIDLQIAAQKIKVKQAQATVEELEMRVDPVLERNLTKAKLTVQAIERQMEERRLRAPYDGRVVAIGLNVQSVAQPLSVRPKIGDNIPAFVPIIALARPEQLEIAVPAERGRATELVVGQTVSVTHGPAPGRAFTATVVAIPVHSLNTGAQPAPPQVVRVGLADDAPPMSIGDYVEIQVVQKVHTDTLVLHPLAVRRFSGRTFVVVEEDGKQRRADVKLGLETPDLVEIISGLREGDRVVGP